jgi:hypothetical protein
MNEGISRRKMLSLLGFGAALGVTLAGVLEKAFLVRECLRNKRSTVSASKSPRDSLGAGIREGH